MALLVCEWVEIVWSLDGHGVPDTVKPENTLQKKRNVCTRYISGQML